MSLQIFRDGRPDREANRVSNALLRKLQKEDDQAEILKDYLANYEGDGTYGFQGVINPFSNKQITAPKGMVGGGHLTMAEKRARVRERMQELKPPKSLAYIEGYETELISDEDAEAFEEGWICPKCIQWQAVVSNECNWRFKGERPSDPKYWGCGYRRDIF